MYLDDEELGVINIKDITFTIIKPGAILNCDHGLILSQIIESGFQIIAMKLIQLTIVEAKAFYAIHFKKDFFLKLCEYMSSNPVIVAILKKNNAVEDYRNLIGSTNPELALDGTIRKMYGISITENAVHGSDSDENALIESNFFFSKIEIFNTRFC